VRDRGDILFGLFSQKDKAESPIRRGEHAQIKLK